VDARYLAATIRWLEQVGCQMLLYGEVGYPECLKHINAAPFLLVQGNLQVLQQPQIPIVGNLVTTVSIGGATLLVN